MAAAALSSKSAFTVPPNMSRESPSISRFGLAGFSVMNRTYLNKTMHSGSCLEINLACVTIKCLACGQDGDLVRKIDCKVAPCSNTREERAREIPRIKTASLASAILMQELCIDNHEHDFSFLNVGFLGCNCQLCCNEGHEGTSCIKWNCLSWNFCTYLPGCGLTFCDSSDPCCGLFDCGSL